MILDLEVKIVVFREGSMQDFVPQNRGSLEGAEWNFFIPNGIQRK